MDCETKQMCLIGAGVFAGAFLIRMVYIFDSVDSPTFYVPIVDSLTYHLTARSIVEGVYQQGHLFWQPIFYQLFLTLVYYISGVSILFAKIVQAFLGAATCVMTLKLGTILFNHRVGVFASIVTAFYGPLIFFESELLATGWAAFWSVTLIVLFVRAAQKKTFLLCLALGVCGATSILTRPTFSPFFMAGCVWLVVSMYKTSDIRFLASRTAVLIWGFLMITVPVSFLNLHETGRFGFLPASGGINFYIGNNPEYISTITTRPGLAWVRLDTLPEQYGITGLWDKQHFFYEKTRDYISQNPFSFFKDLLYKTVQFCTSREIPRNFDLYLFRQWSYLQHVLTWKIGNFGFPFGIIFPLAIFGLVAKWRQVSVPFLLFLILYPAAIILVFVTSRYRVPMIPVMSICAAAGFFTLTEMIKKHQWKRLSGRSMIGIGIVILVSLSGPFPEEEIDYTTELYCCLGGAYTKLDKQGRAIECFLKASELDPDNAEIHQALGQEYMKADRYETAIAHFQKAIEREPDFADAHHSLGLALAKQRKYEDAAREFMEALRIAPSYAKGYYHLGNALVQQGRVVEAVEHYLKALEIDPNLAESHHNIANALAILGRRNEAMIHYREALRLRSHWPEVERAMNVLLSSPSKGAAGKESRAE